MGGNALTSPTRRLKAAEYHALAARLRTQVEQRLGVRGAIVQAYRNKPDFGDLDLIVTREGALAGELDAPGLAHRKEPPPIMPAVQAMVDLAQDYHSRSQYREKNSPTFSFEYRDDAGQDVGFQVDLILVAPEDFDTAQAYFAYNDLGNLVGRLARRLGAKYGPSGLLLPVVEGTQLLDTITLSRDTRQIHQALGLDPDRFERGFDTLDEIFDYALSSTLFHPALYRLENSAHRARMRDRKRSTYRAFLDRCKGLPGAGEAWTEDKAIWRGYLREHFPSLPEKLEQIDARQAQLARVRDWFNGEQVGAWTGLSGKSLGELMQQVRDAAGEDWQATLDGWGPTKTRAVTMRMLEGSQPAQGRMPRP